jgi:ribosomal protein L37AE/L43A
MEHKRGETHKVEHKNACENCGREEPMAANGEPWICSACNANNVPSGDVTGDSSHVVNHGGTLEPG